VRPTTTNARLLASSTGDDDAVFHPTALLARLDDLRRRLTICLLTLFAGLVLCFSVSTQMYRFLVAPLKQALPEGAALVATTVPEIFVVHLQIALFGAVFLAAPVWLYHLWSFVDGVYPLRKRTFLPALALGVALFLSGAAFGHFVLFPIAAHFFTTFGSSSVHVLLSVGTVFSFYIQFVLGMGAAFQIPTVVLVLSQLRLVTPRFLVRHLKYVILIVFTIAAILTPTPDMVTQSLLALPMLALYLLSIVLCWMVQRGRSGAA